MNRYFRPKKHFFVIRHFNLLSYPKIKKVGLWDHHIASVCLYERVPSIFYVETVVFKTLVKTVHYHRHYMILTTDDVFKPLTERLFFRNCSVRNSYTMLVWQSKETRLVRSLPEFQKFYPRAHFFEVSVLLRRVAASLGDGCPVFRDHSYLEILGASHPTMRCQIPENREVQLHHWGSLKTWCLTLMLPD